MEISVIITNYNYEKFVARAIRSVVSQSINKSSYEIIVIDDFSSDNSQNIIGTYSQHINIISNPRNLGLAASCNAAIKSAVGKYIIRLDADDYFHQDCLKLHYLFLENNKIDMNATSSDYLEVDENENVLLRRSGVTFPIACGIMYRRDDIISIGYFDESLPREDEDFRVRFLNNGWHIYNIPIPLYRYCQHKNSLSKKGQLCQKL